MSNTNVHEVPVLIAGAGPAGLTAAAALTRLGIDALLVERRPELSGLPRATAISTRSMEVLRSWGLEEEIRSGGIDVEWLMWRCETLALASAGSGAPVGFPMRQQSAAISPTSPACVPQDHLEPVLLGHLRTLGCRVELGTEVIDVESRRDGVRVAVRDVATGAPRVVHARYLIAADGAHSRVRTALGVPMRGPDDLLQAVTALFRAPLWELLGERRFGIYDITHHQAGGTFLPAGRGDRWLYGVRWQPGSNDVAAFTAERFTRLIRLAAGVAGLQPRIERIGRFKFAAQLAERFRLGSTFLVGDAAHRVTPRGGTGMNTAIHDGYDLSWKLAWVLRGWSGEALLDSYEAERRPVVEHNVARSADPDGSIRNPHHEMHADLGGRIPHVWLPSATGRLSTLDLLGPGLTLFTGPEGEAWNAAAAGVGHPVPLELRPLDTITARAIGIRGGGALLVRPDGTPAAAWPAPISAGPSLDAAIMATGMGGGAPSAAVESAVAGEGEAA